MKSSRTFTSTAFEKPVTVSHYLMRESEDTGLPVFVIKLDAEKERLIAMDKALSSLGIALERMDGVDGNALSPEELSERNRSTRLRKLAPGEMGYIESHVRIWQHIAEGTNLCLQKQWQRKESSASAGHVINKMEEQLLAADRRSWIDPPATIRGLAWKLGSVSVIA